VAIDKDFENFIEKLITAQADVADRAANGAQRRWLDFKEIKEAGQFDEAALKAVFSRQGLNDTFGTLLSEDSRQVKEFQTVKLANDFMAGMERDHAARVRSRIAMFMHGTSRARSNGQDMGPLRRNTLDFMVRLLDEDDKTQAAESTGS